MMSSSFSESCSPDDNEAGQKNALDSPQFFSNCLMGKPRNYLMPDPHWKFEEAIRANHGCDSYWLRSITVTVELRDQLRWRDEVEVFALYDHPKASIAFAWTYRGGGREKIVTVLGIHPIDSAQAAVKSIIGNNAQGATIVPETFGKQGVRRSDNL